MVKERQRNKTDKIEITENTGLTERSDITEQFWQPEKTSFINRITIFKIADSDFIANITLEDGRLITKKLPVWFIDDLNMAGIYTLLEENRDSFTGAEPPQISEKEAKILSYARKGLNISMRYRKQALHT